MNVRFDPARPVGADLFRVVSVLLVAWFHFWQQTWLSPASLLLHAVVRTGYLWVDSMILLSAFCLTLPFALARAQNAPFPGVQGFWRRRAVRILPAYLLCALLGFLAHGLTAGFSLRLWGDLLAHLTFTENFFRSAYLYSQVGGALWTVAVLVGFYLLFPALIRAFWHRPCVTLAALLAGQGIVSVFLLQLPATAIAYRMSFNSLPAFLGTWAVGMGAALLYARPALHLRNASPGAVWGAASLSLAGIVASLFCLGRLISACAHSSQNQVWQLQMRLPWALAVALLLLSLCLLPLPGRRVWRFLSGLTYSFYLYHQQLGVFLKYTLRIPAWAGDVPPNQLGDLVWSRKLRLLLWGSALAAALLSTYLVERPAARFWERRREPAQSVSG